MKAYIYDIKDAEEPHQDDVSIYWFTFNPEEARAWRYRRAAEDDRSLMEHLGVTIPTRNGSHRLRGFQIEEVAPDKFLIYCDGPFEIMGTAPLRPGEV